MNDMNYDRNVFSIDVTFIESFEASSVSPLYCKYKMTSYLLTLADRNEFSFNSQDRPAVDSTCAV